MKHNEFVDEIEKFFAKGLSLVKRKNRDYAPENDPWRNFRFAEIVEVDIARAQLVRISDKLARVSNLLTTDELLVPEEKIEDSLLDISNYAAILAIFVKHQRKGE